MPLAFLTGGTGFVGANLARALLGAGWTVRALVRTGSDTRNLDELPLDIARGDLNDPDLGEAMRGADALFHVAAHYSLWRRDRDALFRSNVLGTRSVLRAARLAGIARTVYTSSVGAIGTKPDGAVADEAYQSAPERLIGAYKLSKYLAEREAFAAAAAGQDVVVVNPTTPLGPWDRKPTPTGELLVRFLRGAMPVVVDTGLNFVDVADVARGHLLAYERGIAGRRYILGNENLSLRALLARVGSLAGRAAPSLSVPVWLPLGLAWIDETILGRLGFEPKIPLDGVRMSREAMYYDASRARTELGFDPQPIDGAIGAAVRWFTDNGYLARRREQTKRCP